jgi:hypothetical protein
MKTREKGDVLEMLTSMTVLDGLGSEADQMPTLAPRASE